MLKMNENINSCTSSTSCCFLTFSVWIGLRAGDIKVEARDQSTAERNKVNSHVNRMALNFVLQKQN